VCGISGMMFHDRHRCVSMDVVRRMCRTLVHRGPDDEGYFSDRNVGLGMRRLNIIDLATGHQPISNENGRVWIVFNGEIYNYRELREDLIHKGHVFATNSDTETIVHAYEEYGLDCVSRLNGMFAFAIWDKDEQKLIIARDRLGVKPLYYFVNDRCVAFGSELKALLACPDVPRTLDCTALDSFLTFEYIPAPLTIFEGVKKLLPGHVLVVEKGKVSTERYWNVSYDPVQMDQEECEQALWGLLKDAVRMRLVSDVPLGAFLSGGIDSSAVVCLMSELMDQPVKTFSIGFDDPSYNELQYARRVADHFGTEHHELTIQPNVVELVDHLMSFLDEPLADVSIFPTYLVSQLARQHVTVALSGDAGDELFAGYDWYVAAKIERYYRWLPESLRKRVLPGMLNVIPPSSSKKGLVNKAKRFVEGAAGNEALQHFRWTMYMTEQTRRDLYSSCVKDLIGQTNPESQFIDYLDEFPSAPSTWQQQYADLNTFLVDDVLVKVDRMSMANSLETRSPFLDFRVAEFAMRLPPQFTLRGLTSKYLLKQCFAKKLPHDILYRKKEGFSIPMKNWLRGPLRPMMEDFLSSQRLKREGYFNPGFVERLKREHIQGSANHSHTLWPLMMFEIWQERFLDPAPRDQEHETEHVPVLGLVATS